MVKRLAVGSSAQARRCGNRSHSRRTDLIKAWPGMIDARAAWRADGQGVVIAIYQSREHADAAMRRLQVIWGSIADLLTGPPRTDVYDTVQHITA